MSLDGQMSIEEWFPDLNEVVTEHNKHWTYCSKCKYWDAGICTVKNQISELRTVGVNEHCSLTHRYYACSKCKCDLPTINDHECDICPGCKNRLNWDNIKKKWSRNYWLADRYNIPGDDAAQHKWTKEDETAFKEFQKENR